MPPPSQVTPKFPALEDSLVHLVRIAGAIAGANEATTRTIMERAVGYVDPKAVDEVIIQSYLFCGFPRTLNAARTWRAISGEAAPASDPSAEIRNSDDWERQGEQTCEIVYGESYQLLRENIRKLHPALDSWMITDGYGKVLSRPQLDLPRQRIGQPHIQMDRSDHDAFHSPSILWLNCSAMPVACDCER